MLVKLRHTRVKELALNLMIYPDKLQKFADAVGVEKVKFLKIKFDFIFTQNTKQSTYNQVLDIENSLPFFEHKYGKYK